MVGPVVVLGMHRSGTSTVARVLNLAGAPLPRASGRGRRSNPANLEGFYEVAALSSCNERLLRALGGDWSAPPEPPGDWTADARLDPLRAQAQRLARRHLGRPGVVFKDPRLCLTLPFWDGLFALQPPVVLVVRNPLEVAESLQVRDQLPMATGLALWERYVRSALDVAAGRPALVIRYEQLVAEPADVVGTVRAWLEARGITGADAAGLAAVSAAVSPSLRRNRHSDEDVAGHPDVSAPQLDLHGAMAALVGPHDRFAPPDVPAATTQSAALLEDRRQERLAMRAMWTTSTPERLRHSILAGASGLARYIRGTPRFRA